VFAGRRRRTANVHSADRSAALGSASVGSHILFIAETGMTFRQWRRQARLVAAIERLARREPVTSVAFDLGYDSVSAFIEAFRKTFGVTPFRYFRQAGPRPTP
jgi:methylphosphotriester-DNA--protein-cysteine methyltransferase